jgi:hypothetical protein
MVICEEKGLRLEKDKKKRRNANTFSKGVIRSSSRGASSPIRITGSIIQICELIEYSSLCAEGNYLV